jgi:hypothetical protein
MLCLACGEEMRLVQVTNDTTMPVSGYEHHMWQCSACSTVEQRMTFSGQKISTQTELLEPIQSVSAPPTQAMPLEPTAAMPAELTEAVPVEATQTKPVEPMQAMPVEPGKSVLVEPTQLEPTHADLPAAMVKTNAWAKALEEKLRDLKERATAARETAGKTARPTQFNRDWDNKRRPVPPASGLSEAWSYVKPDEPLRSLTVPTASSAPTSHDDPVAPGSKAAAARKLRDRLGELVRTVRRWEFSRGH